MPIVNIQDAPASPLSPGTVSSLEATTQHGAYGTRRGGHRPIEPGLVDPAWTRLAMAGIVPILLAVSAALPTWVRLIVICLLVPLTAQGWPALVRSQHDQGATSIVALTGLTAAVVVALRGDYGAAGVVMALSVLAALRDQRWGQRGRGGLVELLGGPGGGRVFIL